MIRLFFIAGFLEAMSYILLLGVAMPLKYIMSIPAPVKYTGWAHGVLFVAYLLILAVLILKHNWKWSYGVLGFIAALLPFGPFIFEKYLKKEEQLTI
jgi:integral membrane protein